MILIQITYHVGEEGVLLQVFRLEGVLSEQLVGLKVVHQQLGRAQDLSIALQVRQAGVHDPEAVAGVDAHPEDGHDLVRQLPLLQGLLLVLGDERVGGQVRVGDQDGRLVTTWNDIDIGVKHYAAAVGEFLAAFPATRPRAPLPFRAARAPGAS